ncbi:MAG: MYXO-CTERM domain-containing protein, partial [Paracoccaceae bacterium]
KRQAPSCGTRIRGETAARPLALALIALAIAAGLFWFKGALVVSSRE